MPRELAPPRARVEVGIAHVGTGRGRAEADPVGRRGEA